MKNNSTITVSAPGKLLLFGDHAVVYGHPCIVTAVGKRMHLTLSSVPDHVLTLRAPDVGLPEYSLSLSDLGKDDIPKEAAFIVAALRRYLARHPIDGGVAVSTQSDFPSTFGFGSSSASVVCMVYALSELYGHNIKSKELFDIAYAAVLDVQQVGSGFDVACAVWGGTILYQSGADVVEQLPVTSLPILVGYSGVKADTVSIVRAVAAKRTAEPEKVERIFTAITDLVTDAAHRLASSEWDRIGTLMNFNQEYLRDLGVSSEKLESLLHAAKEAGALGAKLSGAGGGDCMLAVVDAACKDAVALAINQAGGEVISVDLDAPGVRRETTDNQSEMLIVVDEADQIIEYRTRAECHANSTLMHRTVGVLLTTDNGELVLQKRTMTKDMDAGLWGISAAGHVMQGQTDEEAAHRELREEIGVDTHLEFAGKMIIKNTMESERAVVYTGVHSGPFKAHPDEVAEILCIDPETLRTRIVSGGMKFTQGALQALSLIGVLS